MYIHTSSGFDLSVIFANVLPRMCSDVENPFHDALDRSLMLS
jgi:hypothetical protein